MATEHFDVLIVGAGISGVGAAYHLQQQCPDKTFVALEAMESFGGTWLSHTYPGIRSDSDLYTFGYRFKPWMGTPIATAEEIRAYMGEVIEENDLDQYIRYNHRITNASWSSTDNRWTVEASNGGTPTVITANFLSMCQGYYRHNEGYTPEWPGLDNFAGQILHPETWPTDFECADKQIVVIGSGATAATLIPNIADECAHVTVIQRSPTFYFSSPNSNELADLLKPLDLPQNWYHEIMRRKMLHDQHAIAELSTAMPEVVAAELIKGVQALLGPDYPVERHFTPRYRPWQQRIARVIDGDFFKSIASGKTSMVTDEIEAITATGVRVKSGEEFPADILITATGFNLSVLGDINFVIDGTPLDLADTVTYRGMMFTGVPNLIWTFGYFRASWTLRADLIGDFTCRLLNHMTELGVEKVEPTLRPEDADMPLLPWMDPENFNPSYLMRSMHLLPQRGAKDEWQHSQDYWLERDTLPAANLDDGCLRYT